MARRNRKMDAATRRLGHSDLRAGLLAWREANPRGSVEDLARLVRAGQVTVRRWLDRFEIDLGGPIFIDLRSERLEQARKKAEAEAALAALPRADALPPVTVGGE